MAYRKNINTDERRLRELARTLENRHETITSPSAEKQKNPITTTQKSVTPSFSIKSDAIKLLVIALVILVGQVALSLTSF